MKSFLVIIALIWFSYVNGNAQFNKTVDFGFFVGGSYYIGDLNPNKQLGQFTRPAGGIILRYNFNQRAAVRLNFLMGSIAGDDSYSSSAWQKQRNLSFKSPINELSAQFEFNFLNYAIGGDEKNNFSPYIFLGIGGYHFDPQGQENGDWVSLQSLSTEGQGLPNGTSKKKYKLNQVSIPFGVGFKTGFSKGISIGLEWGMRKTFTDYLDDVSTTYYDPVVLKKERGEMAVSLSDLSKNKDPNYSNTGKQRGNSSTKDWYSFIGIILSIKINNAKSCVGALQMGGDQ